MKVLATYSYRAPEGTYDPSVGALELDLVFVGKPIEVWAELREVFDGIEFLDDHYMEFQMDIARSGEWELDDFSAGQWIKVVALNSKGVTKLTVNEDTVKREVV